MAPSNPPRADGFQVVGTLTELQQQGVLRVPNFASGPLLVVANPKDGNTVLAVDPTCTHQGCPVEWKSDSAAFACPCHGSRFEPGGAVVTGPAVRPLSTYPTLVEGDQILVQAT
jgi:cytochrome b6-f complex iron-sulfur subunit